jgi:hypothetical protein
MIWMVDMEMSEMATELNESMTSEDIAAYADAVAKEVAAERQGDGGHEHNQDSGQEPDASEQAEVKSGSKAAASDAQGEDTGEESSTPDWVSDELKAEVAAYGIDDSDLQEFSSREELDKFVRLLDKKSLEAGRKALAESDQGSARNEKGQFKKQEPEQGEKPAPSSNDDDRYEISLSKDLYDDEIVDEFTRMRDHYESRLSALESRFQMESVKSEEQRFDGFVDSLGHSDLFGKTGDETPEELERRRDLHVAVKAQMIGLERLGRPAEFTDQLVKRVANMVFAEELSKKQLKQQTKKVFKQNQLRQGGSPTKPLPPRDNPRDEADRLYRELEKS